MLIQKEKLTNTICNNFPGIELIIAYGSGVFKQKNYNYNQDSPLIDLIFVVENAGEWHQQNMIRNRSHYSGFGYILGDKYISMLNRHLLPIHFNPSIQLDQFKIKYGVVDIKNFNNDLNNWDSFILAGRLQKPVKFLSKEIQNVKIAKALKNNLIQASSMGFMFLFQEEMLELDFYKIITSLSYAGDIRFTMRAESSNKIDQIVEGNLQNFKRLYLKILNEEPLNKICQVVGNKIVLDCSEQSQMFLINQIPYFLGTSYTGTDKDYIQSFKQIKFVDVQKIMAQELRKKNQIYSKKLIYYNLFATSPVKNLIYVMKKIKKGFLKF